MRHASWLVSLTLLAGCQLGAPLVAEPVGAFVPGELLVQFKPGTSRETALGVHHAVGAIPKDEVTGEALWAVSVPVGQERDFMRRYQNHAEVSYTEYDRLLETKMLGGFRPNEGRITLAAPPIDPLYVAEPTNSYGVKREGLPGQWGMEVIGALDAWDTTQGEEVTVAVLDTGVDMDHPDLAANLDKGNARNCVDKDKESNPDDDFGHGTHVSGIIAGIANNGIGIAGVAPACKVMPVRVLGVEGGTSTTLIAGIDWAIGHGAKVINISLGSSQYNRAEEDAIKRAISRNIVVVAAAGNEALVGNPVGYPAAIPGVVSVGALKKVTDTSAGIVSYVRADFSTFNPFVTVAAPGTDILSTVPRRFQSYGSTHADEPYAYASGTSMASPMVAGVVALIRSAHKDWSATQVISKLRSTCQRLGTTPLDTFYGSGLVQAGKAVQ